ncbi:MAG: hypothetical protein JRG80_04270 [Deltaproteobacteria bacterium]|nr:hypothetical protein [Deltaproteobacteria bacterium]MBW2398468.1 hypothetical protein [Deltaproteobacteria bacterium]MBW2667721.1 hypothetical protein [Deltaproteobacteria bacterium]
MKLSNPATRGCTRAAAQPRRIRAVVLLAWLVPALLAATPLPRGNPASRISDDGSASEYWDLVARFDSGHHLFARFLITNEGPGEKTGVAYGHFVEPDGNVHSWRNGRSQQNWNLGPHGLLLEVGSSDLDLRKQPYGLRIHKKKVKIDLRFEPATSATWDAAARSSEPAVDLLANSAPIRGSVWFRGMPAALELTGRIALTHTWMERSEAKVALRRLDFFSLGDKAAIHLHDFEAPDGTRSHWLSIVRADETLFETSDFKISYEGHSDSQQSADYPIPGTLRFRGPTVRGEIQIKVGLVHHDPMQDIPQPFRFLLSFSMRPHRMWAESPFEVTVGSGPDELKIHGTGLTTVTYLNPPPPPTKKTIPPPPGE